MAARRPSPHRDGNDERHAPGEDQRSAALGQADAGRRGMTDRGQQMDAFLASAGWGDAKKTPLPGDASTRRYVRLERAGRKAMLMDQPQNAEAKDAPPDATPEERAKFGYNALARLAAGDVNRFVAVAKYLRGRGLT